MHELTVHFHDAAEDTLLKFAMIVTRHKGQWVFCKHRARTTYEIPGGHREPGEGIFAAACRELEEETGALVYEICPVCPYSVKETNGAETFGMLYFAEVSSFAPELHHEIESIRLFDTLPDRLTYPLVQPLLIREYQRRAQL